MRFTIRDLFWLMAVAGFAAGWLASHGNVQKRIRRLEIQARSLAQKLAIETNQNVQISIASREIIVTPICARVATGLPPFPQAASSPRTERGDE
jgi:hypothetical protein